MILFIITFGQGLLVGLAFSVVIALTICVVGFLGACIRKVAEMVGNIVSNITKDSTTHTEFSYYLQLEQLLMSFMIVILSAVLVFSIWMLGYIGSGVFK